MTERKEGFERIEILKNRNCHSKNIKLIKWKGNILSSGDKIDRLREWLRVANEKQKLV